MTEIFGPQRNHGGVAMEGSRNLCGLKWAVEFLCEGSLLCGLRIPAQSDSGWCEVDDLGASTWRVVGYEGPACGPLCWWRGWFLC